MVPRIYANFNALIDSPRTDGRIAVPLNTFGSLRDLSNLGILLKEGAELLVYDWFDEAEDLEADAHAYFDSVRKCWIAEFGVDGYRYVEKSSRNYCSTFKCWSCKTDLGDTDEPLDKEYPSCGTDLLRPIAPPTGSGGHGGAT